MIVLDTNILVYARNVISPYHRKAKEIRDHAVDGQIPSAIALQSLSEYLAIVTSPKRVEKPLDVSQAVDDVRCYLEAVQLRKLALTQTAAVHLGMLVKKYKITAQNIFDAQIVAVMLDHQILEIWTSNEKDFSLFDRITVRNPFLT